MNSRSTLDIKEITQLSVIAALMIAGKEALSFLPNIHPVMLLIIIAAIEYGYKAVYPVLVFVAVEIAIYGFGIWSVMYLYIWPIAVILAVIFRKKQGKLFWACFAGIFGLSFGALCSIPYLFTSGLKAAFAYYVAGIPYDLLHGLGNFILVYTLLNPLLKTVEKVRK